MIKSHILIILLAHIPFIGLSQKGDSKNDKKSKREKKAEKNKPLKNRIVRLKIEGGQVSVTDFSKFQINKGSFYVGLYREFLFVKYTGLCIEENYWLNGFNNDSSLAKVSFNYISVPVMFNFNIKGFYFAAGIYGAINLKTSREIGPVKEYFGFQNSVYQQFDWGAVFNIGFKWKFPGFDIRYIMGLKDVLKFTS